MKIALRAALLAMAVALAATGPALAATKKQRFQVTFKGEHGQDWRVFPTDDETTPSCLLGIGASGESQLTAYTRKPTTVSLYADKKKGAIFGQVPIVAYLERQFTVGQAPPDDCLSVEYKELRDGATCDQTGYWNYYDFSPPAFVEVASGGGHVSIGVIRRDEDKILDTIFPRCPFAGVEEGKIEGQAKLSGKRLFDGKPHTIKGTTRRDYPAPEEHSVEGYDEWSMTIKAIKPKSKKRR
jgi:hypothetical protein